MGGDGAEEEEGFGERERGEVQKKPFSSLSLSLRPRSLDPSSSTYASPPQQQQTTSTVLVLNSPFWRFPASFVPLKCRTKFFSFHHFSLVFDEEKRQSSSVSLFSLFSLFSLSSFSLESMTRHEYALEIRRHWAEELLSGRKTVELRRYSLPEAVGKSHFAPFFFFFASRLFSHLVSFVLHFKTFRRPTSRVQPRLAPRHRRPRRPSSPRGHDRPLERSRKGRNRRMGAVRKRKGKSLPERGRGRGRQRRALGRHRFLVELRPR